MLFVESIVIHLLTEKKVTFTQQNVFIEMQSWFCNKDNTKAQVIKRIVPQKVTGFITLTATFNDFIRNK